jgi:hypothetical protein
MTDKLDKSAKKPAKDAQKPNTDMYLVKVQGTYYTATDAAAGNIIKDFNVDVNMPADMLDFAMSHLRNTLIGPAITLKDPGYKRFRTFEIVSVTNLDDPTEPITNPLFMSRAELLKFIDAKELNVEPHLFPTVEELRQAVVECRKDAESFAINQKHIKDNREQEILARTALAQANPSLFK